MYMYMYIHDCTCMCVSLVVRSRDGGGPGYETTMCVCAENAQQMLFCRTSDLVVVIKSEVQQMWLYSDCSLAVGQTCYSFNGLTW